MVRVADAEGCIVAEVGVERAIEELDAALAVLGGIEDPAFDVGLLAREICSALHDSYLGWSRTDDAAAVQWHRDEALAAMARATQAVTSGSEAGDVTTRRICAAAAMNLERAVRDIQGFSAATGADGADLPRRASTAVARASVGTPHLIEGRAAVLVPSTPLAARVADAAQDDDAATEVPSTPVAASHPADVEALLERAASREVSSASAKPISSAVSEPAIQEDAVHALLGEPLIAEQVLRERARACLEDMAGFASMRRFRDDDGWMLQQRTEQRLLARLDALVACGEDQLSARVLELGARPLVDAEMTWALMLTYGCLPQRDAADQCLRLALAQSLDDADLRSSVSDALALAPNPRIDVALPAWLEHVDSERRTVAVSALGRRGTLTQTQLDVALCDAHSDVWCAALDALTVGTLTCDPHALRRVLDTDVPEVRRAALRAGLALGSRDALNRARALLDDGEAAVPEAAMVMALGGGINAHEHLMRRMLGGATEELVEALGWCGHVDALQPLLAIVAANDEALAPAAAKAVIRITGIDPLAEGLATTPSAWLDSLPVGARQHRYRGGTLYTPWHDLAELAARESRGRERCWAHLSLAASVRERVPFDLRNFVHAQLVAIEHWKACLHARSFTPGAWTELTR